MKEISLIYPHQLFENHPVLKKGRDVVLIEDPLFFGDHTYALKFHKMKLTFHRAALKSYENMLRKRKYRVFYHDYVQLKKDKNFLFKWIMKNKYQALHVCKPDDFILSKRILKGSEDNNLKLAKYDNPSFMNNEEYLKNYFSKKKSYFQHYFYIDQRKKFDILIENGDPLGGKWSYDTENRKSMPKELKIPGLFKISEGSELVKEAREYVNRFFSNNPGENLNFYIPVNHNSAKKWLKDFLERKLNKFGDYQDAIVSEETFLFHSLLSPLLNSGLLTPDYVIDETLKFAGNYRISINSVEGFIRQILGWREYIRAIYLIEGVKQRNSNYWNNTRKMPKSFYNGTTGILPIDTTIKKLLKTAYNHHIERLMLIGNFMLLCKIHPEEVYNWFMEMYIDAYDWVMVPNVYGMSQFADGGLMSTKPYISSSNYVKKMSDFKTGNWIKIWDSLFWNFVYEHSEYFLSNNRTVFIARNLEKMPFEKLRKHVETASYFLDSLG